MTAVHRPGLGTRRLVGTGRGAAFVRVNADVDWWCPNRFEATPLLWSLLDADGGVACWQGTEPVRWDPRPAGPTTRGELDAGGRRLSTWDGLVDLGDSTMLASVGVHLWRAGRIAWLRLRRG